MAEAFANVVKRPLVTSDALRTQRYKLSTQTSISRKLSLSLLWPTYFAD